jgi:hypothetical protein
MKLKRVYSNVIPFKGYIALTVYPFVFIRNDKKQKYTPTANRHETIHAHQQIETTIFGIILALMLFIIGAGWWSFILIGLFIELYFLEWIVKLILCGFNTDKAYKSISFEQEAYYNQGKVDYLTCRNDFEWICYIFSFYKKK